MGRQLYRVPLDFNAELNKQYEPEVNPYLKHATKCDSCDGSGDSEVCRNLFSKWHGKIPFLPKERGSEPYSSLSPIIYQQAKLNCERSPEFYGNTQEAIAKESERLSNIYNSSWAYHLNQDDVDALLESGRLNWLLKEQNLQQDQITPEMINKHFLTGMEHDDINAWVVVKAECKRLGEPTKCQHCIDGDIWDSTENMEKAKEWTAPPVPEGEGYQMWSTTNDGPISPVFEEPEELAQWLALNRNGTIDEGMTFDDWLKFITSIKFSPTFVI